MTVGQHLEMSDRGEARVSSEGSQSSRRSTSPTRGVGPRTVLDGAFVLLDTLERVREAGLTRLASEGGLPKTTAYRLLEQLVELNAVERSHDRYRIGPRFFRLGQGWKPYPGLRAAAAGPIRSLAAATGMTVGICVLSGGRALAVAGIPGELEPLASLRPGMIYPWTTAAGKVLVADANRRVPLGPLPSSWGQTAAEIRDRGLAIDREELVPGVCCVATPLYARRGETVAALCALTPPSAGLSQIANVVGQIGRTITAALQVPRSGGSIG